MWLTASHRYQRSGNFPAQRWAWYLLLAATLKKSSSIGALPGKVPPGCVSWHYWLFPLTGHVGEQLTAFHLNIFLVKPTSLPHHSQQWHGALVGPPPLPPQCLPQLPAAVNTAPPPMGKQRRQREGQFSVPDAASKPQTGLWKGCLLHWGQWSGLVWDWGGSLCSVRVQLRQAPWGKHPSKVHPWHSQHYSRDHPVPACPQGVPGPPEAVPLPGPWLFLVLKSLRLSVQQRTQLQTQPVLLWGLATLPFSWGA